GRLPITALVSHYLTNKLIGREPIQSQKTSFHHEPCDPQSYLVLDTVSSAYPKAKGRLLTYYSPVRHSSTQVASYPSFSVRLACVKHAASVRPEPGSNSP